MLTAMELFWTAVGLIAVILVLTAIKKEADGFDWSKGGAEWIHVNYPECCGHEDCEPVAGRVLRIPGGFYRVQGLQGHVPADKVLTSMDGHPWACRNLRTDEIRCLFMPAFAGVLGAKRA